MKLNAIMKSSPLGLLSENYLAALQAHFDHGQKASLEVAENIGREAVAMGMETLDLASVHHHAPAQLLTTDGGADSCENLTACAAAFFTEAITPIEETHLSALKANANLRQLHAALDERMLELEESNRDLKRQSAERVMLETSLRNSQQATGQLLKESRILEKHLQVMAHQILSAIEDERHKMSLLLNDEIAQTLLGINIRILALKTHIASNHTELAREIADTQRLVEDSTHRISCLAHEFSHPHE